MKNLKKYVDDKNRLDEIFGRGVGRPLAPIDLSKLDLPMAQRLYDMLDCDLSPENLTCDGELSRAQVMKRARVLQGAVKDLEAAGYERLYTETRGF